MRIRSLCLLAFALWLMACGTAAPTPLPVENQTRPPLPTAAPLPTIYPTYTPFQPQLVPPVTVAAPTAAPTGTPIDFSRPIITLRYAIPALGLERTLQGTLDSTIQLVDLAAGTSIALPNQRRALLELQSVLPSLQLDELPDNCGRCVAFSYELAATGQSGAGWLKDVVLMASVEQFFAINLGPTSRRALCWACTAPPRPTPSPTRWPSRPRASCGTGKRRMPRWATRPRPTPPSCNWRPNCLSAVWKAVTVPPVPMSPAKPFSLAAKPPPAWSSTALRSVCRYRWWMCTVRWVSWPRPRSTRSTTSPCPPNAYLWMRCCTSSTKRATS
ncbi:MAG: hypothetical protein IPL28_23440 [Chloroflexi bacterium]|nr:hypothetical protein [Chloroflexota bacterium]